MIGSLGGPELLLILVLALIVFGPRKLPEIGKSLGKMIVEFRRAGTDFKRTIEEEVDAEKLKADLQVPLLTAPDPPAAPVAGTVPAVEPPVAEATPEPADLAPVATGDEPAPTAAETAPPTSEEAPAGQGR